MTARCGVQPLKRTIEIIDDTGVEAVDVNRCVVRLDVEAYGRVAVVIAIRRIPASDDDLCGI